MGREKTATAMTGRPSRVLVFAPDRSGEYAEALEQAAVGVGLEIRAASSPAEAWEERLWAEIFLGAGLEAELLLGMPSLRWIQWAWAGVDQVMGNPAFVSAVSTGRFLLTRVVGVFGAPLAEYILGWCLFVTQDMPRTLQARRDRLWRRFTPERLAGKRLGLAGMGAIGTEVARRAAALDLEVWALRRSGGAGSPASQPGPVTRIFGPDGLPEFVGGLDFLAVVLPLTAETRGFISGDILRLMKPTAALINVARGGIVEERGLLDALGAGRPAWAVLDVTAQEPLPATSLLWSHPNVLITPHHAGISRPADIVALFLRNLVAFRTGRTLEGVVSGDLGY
jgi:phosphoglycerate dehydrogenase-like enzyme